jgi:hypothetical protein
MATTEELRAAALAAKRIDLRAQKLEHLAAERLAARRAAIAARKEKP